MSTVTGLVFLVNKQTRTIQYAGDLPEAIIGLTGLQGVDYEVLKDLHPIFRESESDPRFLHLGFLTEADTIAAGVSLAEVQAKKMAAHEIKWNSLEQERQDLIQAQRWRVDRYSDQTMMSLPISENIIPVLWYIQQIRDLPETNPDPYNIVWPTIPPLPGE
jgi:hypothetical protein